MVAGCIAIAPGTATRIGAGVMTTAAIAAGIMIAAMTMITGVVATTIMGIIMTMTMAAAIDPELLVSPLKPGAMRRVFF